MYVEQASCTVGGLVATNSGKITSCSFESYEGILKSIKYSTTDKNEQYASVAGLVAINEATGNI